MTKKELADLLRGDKRLGLTARLSSDIVSTVFDLIGLRLIEYPQDKVTVRGFGTFGVRRRTSFIGRNPKTGEPVAVAEKRTVHFRASKELTTKLNS